MSRVRGFTLLEVLVAVLVFSLGLIGMAGLMVVSVKTNHSAYLRTQAGFVAQSIADRIRLNRPAGPQNYNGTYVGISPPSVAPPDPCLNGAVCPPATVVTRDLQFIWRPQLGQLPNATGVINCVGALQNPAIMTSPFVAGAGPGLCTVTVTWAEASLSKGSSNIPNQQTFAWVFQP